MTQEVGSQPKQEIKLLPVSEMEKMSHAELYKARTNAKTPEEQRHIAPYEHRAFAREYVEENPVTGAIGLAVAIPGYQAAKAVGATGSRTGVDSKQMVEGYKGVAEGLSKGIVEPWKRVWNRVEEAISPPISKNIPVKPWEKNWEGRPEGIKSPSVAVKRNKAEEEMAAMVAAPDTGAGLTAGALQGILVDLEAGKLSPKQQEQLKEALKGIRN